MDSIIERIGLSQLTNIPEQCKNLYIDVGLAIDGPNAAHWLTSDPDNFVVGIEPHPGNIDILRKGRPASATFNLPYLCLKENSVKRHGYKMGDINGRFCLLEGAIDNVEQPTHADFYLTDERNTGCSSLLKPTTKLGLDVIGVYKTPVVSLKHILDFLVPKCFSHVTFLKTDAQGKDLDVVKSCQEYLQKILIIQMEVFTDGKYENEQKLEEIEQLMLSNNFAVVKDDKLTTICDRIYINLDLSDKVKLPKINFIET